MKKEIEIENVSFSKWEDINTLANIRDLMLNFNIICFLIILYTDIFLSEFYFKNKLIFFCLTMSLLLLISYFISIVWFRSKYYQIYDCERFDRIAKTSSMEPALPGGSVIKYHKFNSIDESLSVGSIIIARKPRSVKKIVKRIYRISTEGIDIRGDNKNNSNDSRYFGLVPINNIIGIVDYRVQNPFEKYTIDTDLEVDFTADEKNFRFRNPDKKYQKPKFRYKDLGSSYKSPNRSLFNRICEKYFSNWNIFVLFWKLL